jgi:Second Messenger Oligonucleotide or Dinucleotide Synthetase domain
MAKTVEQAFKTLRANLEITDLQENTVSTRQKNVREAAEKGLSVLDTFLTGSYRRNTMIRPLKEADIDVFIVLDPKHFDDGPAALLESTKKVMKTTYPKTPSISPNGQAVTITFTDFKVDIVPGFYRTGGGYYIPDAERNVWVPTDPKKHVEIWSAHNKTHNGSLIPLIKILKAWNKNRKVVRSFHLEALALRVFEGVTISNDWSGARYFFDKARHLIRVKLADPAGYNDDVAAHVASEAQMTTIETQFSAAYWSALECERLSSEGEEREAIELWQKIFPLHFPAYN